MRLSNYKTVFLAVTVAVTFSCLKTMANAQSEDETDLSRYTVVEEGDKPTTLTQLDDMQAGYRNLLMSKGCSTALPDIVEFAQEVNKTANLIQQGSEPFYDASRDDRSDLMSRDRKLFERLLNAERAANSLKMRRNEAWVDEAKCNLETSRTGLAVSQLFRALDFIDVQQRELWEEALKLLWGQVGFNN